MQQFLWWPVTRSRMISHVLMPAGAAAHVGAQRRRGRLRAHVPAQLPGHHTSENNSYTLHHTVILAKYGIGW
jgi:hypothetical protein